MKRNRSGVKGWEKRQKEIYKIIKKEAIEKEKITLLLVLW